MWVSEHVTGDRERLVSRIRKEKIAKQRDRLRAVALALDGHETQQIAVMLGRSRRFVQDWVYRYRDHGLEAIKVKKQPGRAPKLPRAREDELRARLDAGPTEADGVCAWRGHVIQRILEREFAVRYSLNGVYDLLHRLGYSYLAPRPQHRKTDHQAQEAFKASAPLLLTKSGASTRINALKSGSRMSCEPVNRAR